MNARTSLHSLKQSTAPIAKLTRPAKPPTFSPLDTATLHAFNNWIAWEKTNPISYEDPVISQHRVIYAYKIALLTMRHWPEMWCEYAAYIKECGRLNESIDILKQAIEILPGRYVCRFFVGKKDPTDFVQSLLMS